MDVFVFLYIYISVQCVLVEQGFENAKCSSLSTMETQGLHIMYQKSTTHVINEGVCAGCRV